MAGQTQWHGQRGQTAGKGLLTVIVEKTNMEYKENVGMRVWTLQTLYAIKSIHEIHTNIPNHTLNAHSKYESMIKYQTDANKLYL